MYQQQTQVKPSHSDLEEFKKNYMKKIRSIARQKKAWVKEQPKK